MKIHVFTSLFILLFAMLIHMKSMDVILIMFSIGLVTATEAFNTAIEKTVDLFTKEFHPYAKAAKDVAAGGVLIATFIAISIGIIVLFPYLQVMYYQGFFKYQIELTPFITVEGLFLLILTYVVKAWWMTGEKEKRKNQPHVLVGILLFIFALLSNYLPIILALIYVMRKQLTIFGLLQNILISIGGFYLLFWLFV